MRLVIPQVKLNIKKCLEVYLFSQQMDLTLCLVLVYVLVLEKILKQLFRKSLFGYIKGTTQLGVWYPKRTGIETIVYTEWNYVGNKLIRKAQVVLALLYLLTQ